MVDWMIGRVQTGISDMNILRRLLLVFDGTLLLVKTTFLPMIDVDHWLKWKICRLVFQYLYVLGEGTTRYLLAFVSAKLFIRDVLLHGCSHLLTYLPWELQILQQSHYLLVRQFFQHCRYLLLRQIPGNIFMMFYSVVVDVPLFYATSRPTAPDTHYSISTACYYWKFTAGLPLRTVISDMVRIGSKIYSQVFHSAVRGRCSLAWACFNFILVAMKFILLWPEIM